MCGPPGGVPVASATLDATAPSPNDNSLDEGRKLLLETKLYGTIDEFCVDASTDSGAKEKWCGRFCATWNSVVTLASSCLGAGVLSFPYCFRESGLCIALILCLGFGGLLAFSCWAVGYCCNEAQKLDPAVRTYHALVEHAGGARLATLVEVVMWLYLFGISLSFCIIIGDVAQPLLSEAFGSDSFLSNRAACVGMICAVMVLPLCLLRDISHLGASSGVAVAAVVYVVMVVGVYACSHYDIEGSGIELVGDAAGSFKSMPIIGFGLGCHIQAPIIFSELTGPDRMHSFTWVIVAAFGLCITVYTLCGLAGYLTFGASTPQNILDVHGDVGYPISSVPFIIAKICVLLVSVCGLPLNHFPARQAMYSLFSRCWFGADDSPGSPGYFHIVEVDSIISADKEALEIPLVFSIVETVLFVGLVYLTSLGLNQLATAFDLFGAICGSLEILIVPGILWWHFGASQSSFSRGALSLCFCAVGFAVMVSGTYVSIQSMV